MSSEACIDIIGNELCDVRNVRVERSMPTLLHDHMTDLEWNMFCNSLDGALKPLTSFKTLAIAISAVAFTFFVVFLVCAIMAISTRFEKRAQFYSWFILLIVAPIMFILGGYSAAIVIKKGTRLARDRVMAVCNAESRRHPGMSFHVRFGSMGGEVPHVFIDQGRLIATSSYVSSYVEC